MIPARLTRISGGSAVSLAISASSDLSSARSQNAVVSQSRQTPWSTPTTRTPALRNCLATGAPMPPAAPVTTAFSPSSERMGGLHLDRREHCPEQSEDLLRHADD